MTTRAEAAALAYKSIEGAKRRAVFAVIAGRVLDGPAAVSYRTLLSQSRQETLIAARSLDHITARLRKDGYVRLVRESQPNKPRVWDFGPRITQVTTNTSRTRTS